MYHNLIWLVKPKVIIELARSRRLGVFLRRYEDIMDIDGQVITVEIDRNLECRTITGLFISMVAPLTQKQSESP